MFCINFVHSVLSSFAIILLRKERAGPEIIKLFSCSTQLSTKFQLLLKIKISSNKVCLALRLSDVVFIMCIYVKMPTIVGILTFMSRINFVLCI